MNKCLCLCVVVALLPAVFFAQEQSSISTATLHHDTPELFQVSTLDALMLGLYQGVYQVSALKQHGDFGLGAFEGIDGEMTVLNGHVYHFHSDGELTEAPDRALIPFAVVTKFHPCARFAATASSLQQLDREIDAHIPSSNLFYAIKIHGRFPAITTRAIPKFVPPYPPLTEALAEQVQFPVENIEGTIVAFRCPAWVKGINQVGYHHHFISDDRTLGGHILTLVGGVVTVELQELDRNEVWVPSQGPFLTAPLPTHP